MRKNKKNKDTNSFKSFKLKPYLITDNKNNIINDKKEVLEELKEEIKNITSIAEWSLHNDDQLLNDIRNYDGFNNASKIGIALGIKLPDGIIACQRDNYYNYIKNNITLEEYNNLNKKNSGNSRREWLLHRRIVDEAKSWIERIDAKNNSTDKYVSQGWSRTVNSNVPFNIKDKISLSITDNQYAKIINDPFNDGIIILKMVINGSWYHLHFKFDKDRFKDCDRLCLPDVTVENNNVIFNFTVEYHYIYKDITTKYFIGVDVNISDYAVVSIINDNGDIVHSTKLSRRVHSLTNSIKATSKQIVSLHKKSLNYAQWDDKYIKIKEEISLQRAKNSRKKIELSILAAQEISYLSYIWDNAVIAFEDLSWIENTMQNGRWNRGELVKRTKEYCTLNGGRVIKVNAANTSKNCFYCGESLYFKSWKIAHCDNCDIDHDRDVNAACNIAQNSVNTVMKISESRRKAKKYAVYNDDTTLRTPVTRDVLSYRKTDRSKKCSTSKCDNKKKGRQFRIAKERFRGEVVSDCYSTATRNDDVTVLVDVEQSKCFKQDPDKATKDFIFNKLYDLLI